MGGDLRDLRVWREAAGLAADVVRIAGRMRGPAAVSSADQVVRAAESIAANIAEGYGRGFGRDGARFLRIARGSAAELESHLCIAVDAGRLQPEELQPIIARTRLVRAMINGLTQRVGARRSG